MNSAALRQNIESLLLDRHSTGFTHPGQSQPDTVSTGIEEIDRLTGGLPRGRITEVYGPDSSGRTTLLLSSIAQITEQEEFCGIVDPDGTFDPVSAEAMGVDLGRLLWVRTKVRKNMDQTLKALDLLLQGGGFGLIGVDLGNIAPSEIRRVPLSSWFRLQRAAENTPTILLFIARESHIQTCASLVLALKQESTDWSDGLLLGIQPRAEILRSRTKPIPLGQNRSDVFGLASVDGLRAVPSTGSFPNKANIEGVHLP
jgi:recombination protein RecA